MLDLHGASYTTRKIFAGILKMTFAKIEDGQSNQERLEMNQDRLDPRAIERLNGEAWRAMRPAFDRLNDVLLSVSPTAKG